jgi:hypothetical protein
MIERLTKGLASYFKYGMVIAYDRQTEHLNLELSPMGRNLYPDESSEAEPHKLGMAVSVDAIRWEKISAYVNGFMQAVS